MKRLKSALASVLLISAGLAALGLGTALAIASLAIGLVIAVAARLAIGAREQGPDESEINDMTSVPASCSG